VKDNEQRTCVVAIVGGSGAGKTWLANRLIAQLEDEATRLSLDDFYLDRSDLDQKQREKLNFDTPEAIDWPVLGEVLVRCRQGELSLPVPRYDFNTHTRSQTSQAMEIKPVLVVEGLWLFHRPELRELFDLKVFVECPRDLRFCRRMERDVLERGRTAGSVTEQFKKTVAPMHERHVQPQARWADEIICSPPTEEDVQRVVQLVKAKAEATAKSLCHAVNNGN
jgi:uridine kinase